MTLPSKLLIITSRHHMRPTFEAALLAALQGGARWLHFREKDLEPREAMALYTRAHRLAERFNARLFWNGRADVARAVHADGIHLPESEISVDVARTVLGFHTPCGVSVHSLEAARRAAGEGADYLLFGPVFETQSHPGELAAGLESLRAVAAAVNLPVYAVGGVTAERAGGCLDAGAAGVAVIGAVWKTDDITAATRALRAAMGEPDAPLHGHASGQKSPFFDIIAEKDKREA